MSEEDWYEPVVGPSLLQGDLIMRCPIFTIEGGLKWPIVTQPQVHVDAKTLDVIVVTQSCELDNRKTDTVLLARIISWQLLVRRENERGNESVKGSKFRKLLIDGFVPGLSLLNKRVADPGLPWSVVDFRQIFGLPRTFLEQFAGSQSSRLRLRSPYREHLAQAFARFFMRVGLPDDASAFEKEGAVDP